MFDRHEYEALEAEAYLKGQARGMEKGMEKGAQQEREKNDADNAARDTKRAEFFRSKGVSEAIIAEGFALKQLPCSLEIALTARRKPGFSVFTKLLRKNGIQMRQNGVLVKRDEIISL